MLYSEIERLQKIIGKQAIEKIWEISKERKRRRVSLMRPIGQFFKRSIKEKRSIPYGVIGVLLPG